MKYNELVRRLKEMGIEFTRFGAGSHEIWRNPVSGKQTTIPYHRTKDFGVGLLAKILKELGIDRNDFERRSKP